MCGTTLPMCWKCSSAIMESDPEMAGVSQFRGCREQPGITDYSQAQALCPLTKKESVIQSPEYIIKPCDPPSEGAADAWPGQWYKFTESDRPDAWGYAASKMLHLYVGREQAERIIAKHEGV